MKPSVVTIIAWMWMLTFASGADVTFFAFDDHAVPWRDNLRLTLVQAEKHPANPVLRCGPITLDISAHTVQVDNLPLELTGYEYKVLEYLMLNRGKVISKTELTEHVYDQDFDRDSNTIEVFIGRLRRKLDPDNRYQPVETLRGRGYRFALECGET